MLVERTLNTRSSAVRGAKTHAISTAEPLQPAEFTTTIPWRPELVKHKTTTRPQRLRGQKNQPEPGIR